MTDIGSQLIDAATMMATGMTVVFVFLTILVFLVRLMSKLVGPTEEELTPAPVSKPIQTATQKSGAIPPQVVAAISAAVHQHRSQATAK